MKVRRKGGRERRWQCGEGERGEGKEVEGRGREGEEGGWNEQKVQKGTQKKVFTVKEPRRNSEYACMHVHGGQRFFLAGRWELVAILERKGGSLTQFMSKEAKPMRKDEEEGRGGRVAQV